MKCEYESDDDLRTAVRCLPALAMVPSSDVLDAFLTLSDNMPQHEMMQELFSYFEHTYVRGRRNHYETASEGVARTTNSVEGWHFGLQALFQCHHPTLWTFMKGISKEMQMQRTKFLQGISGLQPTVHKRYTILKQRVQNAVGRYSMSEILIYLRSIVHLSYV